MEVRFLSPKLRTRCNKSNLVHVYTAIIERRKSQERKLTFERNELMYNFFLVLRALIANRFVTSVISRLSHKLPMNPKKVFDKSV